MLIENKSEFLLQLTQSKAKMFEYSVPLDEHVKVQKDAIKLLLIAVGCLDEVSDMIIHSETQVKLEIDSKMISDLHFSAVFFDSLINSRIDNDLNTNYYYLLGATSYFFCDYIGSAKVMLSFINQNILVDGGGFEKAIWYVLHGNRILLDEWIPQKRFEKRAKNIVNNYFDYFDNGIMPNLEENFILFNEVLFSGTDREVFLCEILIALIKKKVLDSALNLLPYYTGLPKQQWLDEISKNHRLTELWPSQKRLGENGFFNSRSGIVQMPTSSGKTTGISIMFQTMFLKKSGTIGIVIAPFRALCKEISRDLDNYFINNTNIKVMEIFDVPDKTDITWFSERDENIIFVITPEKLLYLLRLDVTILEKIELLIFDEAHLFDDPHRGTKYELLIATIKKFLAEFAQIVLISAVIPNADTINDWINNGKGVVVADNAIKATEKSIAIGDWIDGQSRLTFINPENPDRELYYVPRVVNQVKLERFPRDRKDRFFPELDVVKQIRKPNTVNDLSIYYSLKLLRNGSVAIFCGIKTSVRKIIERILEIEKRNYDISIYSKACKNDEHKKIALLIEKNLGLKSIYVEGAKKGIFPHHADIPSGIKYSIEYAMSERLIGFVVCTSTLAQGVNLPIKYLIISNISQAGKRISVRDFHNLIGRTGRAGKYTEGSVILTEPFIYNNRTTRQSRNRWNKYETLIDARNSEPCESTIIQLIRPVNFYLSGHSDLVPLDFFNVILNRYIDFDKYKADMKKIHDIFENKYHDQVWRLDDAWSRIKETLNEIENYVLSSLDDRSDELLISSSDLAGETFGYFIASEDERKKIIQLFEVIFQFVLSIPIEERSKVAKASLGAFRGRKIIHWTKQEQEMLVKINSTNEIIRNILPEVFHSLKLPILKNIVNQNWLLDICDLWISGCSYEEIFIFCSNSDMQVLRSGNAVPLSIDDLIKICDKLFAYECLLPLSAISNTLSERDNFEGSRLFNLFSKRMKYGLPDSKSIIIFELGFSDRFIAQTIAERIPNHFNSKSEIQRYLRRNKDVYEIILSDYPSYFLSILNKI